MNSIWELENHLIKKLNSIKTHENHENHKMQYDNYENNVKT